MSRIANVRCPIALVGSSLLVAALVSAVPLVAQHEQHGGEGAYAAGDPLGTVEFPISCTSGVGSEFERGVALLHHMMYVESRAVFSALARAHPECAMPHWGVAMTLFQPLWPTRPSAQDLARGWEAVATARSAGGTTAREDAYIAAAEAFFREPSSADYWPRILRFEAGMKAVYESFPEDREAASLYSLSLLASAAQADDPGARHERAAELLLAIYEDEPTHPGAIHYTIHANDVDGRATERLDVVRSYDDIAPSVPHALHMPTHIFVRLGAWDDVIHWNEKSAAAALEFPAGDKVSHHYPHALDYLIYAHLQKGDDAAAVAVLKRARERAGYQPTFISAFHLASMPARVAVERRDWEAAAELPLATPTALPWESFPWPQAITWFAKGLGAARSGDVDGARVAISALERLEVQAREAGEIYFETQIRISRTAIAGWMAFEERSHEEAVDLVRAAAELESSTEKHPVTPGALLPAYELLGDLLMELDRPSEASAAYELSLQKWPRRFHSVLGAARAAATAGDRATAGSFYSELLELAADSASRTEEVAEARAFPRD